jgi:hypothetical protein
MKIIMPLLWAILVAMVSFACVDTIPENDPNLNNVILEDIIITDVAFYKVGYKRLPEGGYWLTQLRVDEYKVGDTMAIWCATKPFRSLPTFAIIKSHKTGAVQNINFVYAPIIEITDYVFQNISYSIAYISPVIHTSLTEPLVPDPNKEPLEIDTKGDMLTAEIIYNGQTLTKIINVRGY